MRILPNTWPALSCSDAYSCHSRLSLACWEDPPDSHGQRSWCPQRSRERNSLPFVARWARCGKTTAKASLPTPIKACTAHQANPGKVRGASSCPWSAQPSSASIPPRRLRWETSARRTARGCAAGNVTSVLQPLPVHRIRRLCGLLARCRCLCTKTLLFHASLFALRSFCRNCSPAHDWVLLKAYLPKSRSSLDWRSVFFHARRYEYWMRNRIRRLLCCLSHWSVWCSPQVRGWRNPVETNSTAWNLEFDETVVHHVIVEARDSYFPAKHFRRGFRPHSADLAILP